MDPLVGRVAQRYSFKYEPKETKEHKVDRIKKLIRDTTGLSGGMSEAIADAHVRGREVDRLALQKGWPIVRGLITGDRGSIGLEDLK